MSKPGSWFTHHPPLSALPLPHHHIARAVHLSLPAGTATTAPHRWCRSCLLALPSLLSDVAHLSLPVSTAPFAHRGGGSGHLQLWRPVAGMGFMAPGGRGSRHVLGWSFLFLHRAWGDRTRWHHCASISARRSSSYFHLYTTVTAAFSPTWLLSTTSLGPRPRPGAMGGRCDAGEALGPWHLCHHYQPLRLYWHFYLLYTCKSVNTWFLFSTNNVVRVSTNNVVRVRGPPSLRQGCWWLFMLSQCVLPCKSGTDCFRSHTVRAKKISKNKIKFTNNFRYVKASIESWIYLKLGVWQYIPCLFLNYWYWLMQIYIN
jgi:hypothetical protein